MAEDESEPKPIEVARENMGFGPPFTRSSTVPPLLHDRAQRKAYGLPEEDDVPGPYMIELNLDYRGGWKEAKEAFEAFYKQVLGPAAESRPAVVVSKNYFRCRISVNEWRELVGADEARGPKPERLIYKIWPDFKLKPLIDRSIATVKADAALRAYSATGAGIVWAVIDSGIDKRHLHFVCRNTLEDAVVAELHRDFSLAGEPDKSTAGSALTDNYGHGTHVAGIIAGGLVASCVPKYQVYEGVLTALSDTTHDKTLQRRNVSDPEQLRGVARDCKLVSLKVLDDAGEGNASNIICAMRYIREDVNGDPKLLRIHGVNISLGYDFDAEMFACGQSPLCVEVDRLVKSGVVVVAAAGNSGYGKVYSANGQASKAGISNSINDPGNASLAITVGSTHRDMPHTYGVSYFSSKGPTGDGRMKPDLVAPGERITSCAAGALMPPGWANDEAPCAYVDDSGTSMAAPHVSGVIAAFLSIRREFIQRPEDVKRIFLESATPLGRERYFEGRGLVDLMRAIQSV